MRLEDFGYESEADFIAAAVDDLSVRRQLLSFTTHEMKAVAHNLAVKWDVPEQSEVALLASGMSAFPKAFDIYIKNIENHHAGERHFILYFTWWFRQSAADLFLSN